MDGAPDRRGWAWRRWDGRQQHRVDEVDGEVVIVRQCAGDGGRRRSGGPQGDLVAVVVDEEAVIGTQNRGERADTTDVRLERPNGVVLRQGVVEHNIELCLGRELHEGRLEHLHDLVSRAEHGKPARNSLAERGGRVGRGSDEAREAPAPVLGHGVQRAGPVLLRRGGRGHLQPRAARR